MTQKTVHPMWRTLTPLFAASALVLGFMSWREHQRGQELLSQAEELSDRVGESAYVVADKNIIISIPGVNGQAQEYAITSRITVDTADPAAADMMEKIQEDPSGSLNEQFWFERGVYAAVIKLYNTQEFDDLTEVHQEALRQTLQESFDDMGYTFFTVDSADVKAVEEVSPGHDNADPGDNTLPEHYLHPERA